MLWSEALEYAAVLFGVLYVALIARENLLGWPAGLIGALCSIVVLFPARLYLDAALYAFYAVLTAYGWFHWVCPKAPGPTDDAVGRRAADHSRVRHISRRSALGLLALGAASTFGLGWVTSSYTDADVPYWDAWTSCYSVIGTFMQAHKLFENWMLWIVVNSVYIGLYWYKGLSAFSVVSLLYVGLAVYGHIQWREKLTHEAQGIPT